MAFLARARALGRNLFRRSRVERETDEELRSFLEAAVDEARARGLSPEAARREALVATGSVEAVKDRVRDARAGASIEAFLRDARLALRQVRRQPGFAVAVVLTLALGIGANSAVYSVIQAVLLDPLPYRDPQRLQIVWSDLEQAGYRRGPISGPELQDLRAETSLYSGFASIWATSAPLTGDGEPEQARVAYVTANFFDLLGVDPAAGRFFVASDEGGGREPVVVLSDRLWRRRYGADPAVIGRVVHLAGIAATIVGVAPSRLRLWFPPDASVPIDPSLYMPFQDPIAAAPRDLYYLRTLGRLADGADPAAAAQQVAALGPRLAARHPDYAASGRSFYALPLAADAAREVRSTLLALLGAVGLVLLLACVNVSNLLIGRELGRRTQMAVRAALGATRGMLARQALVEAGILALAGVAAGLGVGALGLRLLARLRPPGLERLESVHLDPTVLFLTAGVGFLAALLVTAVAVHGVSGIDLTGFLRGAGRGGAEAPRRRARRILVAAEVALGAVLLVGAGLLARSVTALEGVDPGFRPDGVLTFRVGLPFVRYPGAEPSAAFDRALEARLRALPGVEAVGNVSALPFDTLPNWSSPYRREGEDEAALGGREADARAIGPGFFRAIGGTLLAGREFDEQDGPGKAPVVIVDDRLAARGWPDGRALDRKIQVVVLDPATGNFVPVWARVVGVVRHVRHRQLTEVVREQVWVPQRQYPRQPHALLLRLSGGDPEGMAAAIRAAVGAIDPEIPVYDLRPLGAYVGDALARSRFAMRLAGLFAALALAVAAIGIFGVVSYDVTRRRREIGIRLALGAERRAVCVAILREGVVFTSAGLLVGLAAAVPLASAARSLLFGIGPQDPVTLALVAATLLGTAVTAALHPALRASRTDPNEILRAD